MKTDWKAAAKRWRKLAVAHCTSSLPQGHAHSKYRADGVCTICYETDPKFKEKMDSRGD